MQIIKDIPTFLRDIFRSAHGCQRNIRFRGDNSLRKFVFAHFQAEDHGCHIVVQRGGSCEIDAERGLAHGGASCHNDHLARLQALRHFVDVAESGWYALGDFAVLQSVDLVKGVGDDGADRRVILPHFAGRHFVDFGLRQVDDVFGLGSFGRVAELRYFGAGCDHIAQDGALMDDVGIEGCVGCGRHGCDEAVQIVGSPHFFEVAVFEQLIGYQHRVDGLRCGEQVDDGFVHGLVTRLVEIGDVDHL